MLTSHIQLVNSICMKMLVSLCWELHSPAFFNFFNFFFKLSSLLLWVKLSFLCALFSRCQKTTAVTLRAPQTRRFILSAIKKTVKPWNQRTKVTLVTLMDKLQTTKCCEGIFTPVWLLFTWSVPVWPTLGRPPPFRKDLPSCSSGERGTWIRTKLICGIQTQHYVSESSLHLLFAYSNRQLCVWCVSFKKLNSLTSACQFCYCKNLVLYCTCK